MSQQEFDMQDQETIRVANRELQKKNVAAPAKETKNAKEMEMQRRMLWTAIQVVLCVIVAVLFVAALIDTTVVAFLANAGVLVCGMVAAVKIDRSICAWKKGR